ncbi:hypothetical protein ADUPG1_011368 [Aduncisulcus paluster]|uniref:Suppressor of forked domain-containing protein n=1 Tax=Aduncisulcus paluster TaxID=2918883 RepID=A0ABQ5JVC4_9EUKA|nr:hypothetical protein ADUPG1_011368 [Aduncisulcus paluster]
MLKTFEEYLKKVKSNKDSSNRLIDAYIFALERIGYHHRSYHIWKEFLILLEEQIKHAQIADREEWIKLTREVYIVALNQPILKHNRLLDDYDTFLRKYENAEMSELLFRNARDKSITINNALRDRLRLIQEAEWQLSEPMTQYSHEKHKYVINGTALSKMASWLECIAWERDYNVATNRIKSNVESARHRRISFCFQMALHALPDCIPLYIHAYMFYASQSAIRFLTFTSSALGELEEEQLRRHCTSHIPQLLTASEMQEEVLREGIAKCGEHGEALFRVMLCEYLEADGRGSECVRVLEEGIEEEMKRIHAWRAKQKKYELNIEESIEKLNKWIDDTFVPFISTLKEEEEESDTSEHESEEDNSIHDETKEEDICTGIKFPDLPPLLFSSRSEQKPPNPHTLSILLSHLLLYVFRQSGKVDVRQTLRALRERCGDDCGWRMYLCAASIEKEMEGDVKVEETLDANGQDTSVSPWRVYLEEAYQLALKENKEKRAKELSHIRVEEWKDIWLKIDEELRNARGQNISSVIQLKKKYISLSHARPSTLLSDESKLPTYPSEEFISMASSLTSPCAITLSSLSSSYSLLLRCSTASSDKMFSNSEISEQERIQRLGIVVPVQSMQAYLLRKTGASIIKCHKMETQIALSPSPLLSFSPALNLVTLLSVYGAVPVGSHILPILLISSTVHLPPKLRKRLGAGICGITGALSSPLFDDAMGVEPVDLKHACPVNLDSGIAIRLKSDLPIEASIEDSKGEENDEDILELVYLKDSLRIQPLYSSSTPLSIAKLLAVLPVYTGRDDVDSLVDRAMDILLHELPKPRVGGIDRILNGLLERDFSSVLENARKRLATVRDGQE